MDKEQVERHFEKVRQRQLDVRTHRLKTHPAEYAASVAGLKLFDFRKNDRGFAVGDCVYLLEWDPAPVQNPLGQQKASVRGSTGREHRFIITYILHGGRFGVPEGYCVLSLRSVEGLDAERISALLGPAVTGEQLQTELVHAVLAGRLQKGKDDG